MKQHTFPVSLAEGAVELPAHWVICPQCNGEGRSSAYLGDFTATEFDEQFDPDEQEDYFSGAYDRPCDNCSGSGKVLAVDREECELQGLGEALKEYDDELDAEAYAEAEHRAETWYY